MRMGSQTRFEKCQNITAGKLGNCSTAFSKNRIFAARRIPKNLFALRIFIFFLCEFTDPGGMSACVRASQKAPTKESNRHHYAYDDPRDRFFRFSPWMSFQKWSQNIAIHFYRLTAELLHKTTRNSVRGDDLETMFSICAMSELVNFNTFEKLYRNKPAVAHALAAGIRNCVP